MNIKKFVCLSFVATLSLAGCKGHTSGGAASEEKQVYAVAGYQKLKREMPAGLTEKQQNLYKALAWVVSQSDPKIESIEAKQEYLTRGIKPGPKVNASRTIYLPAELSDVGGGTLDIKLASSDVQIHWDMGHLKALKTKDFTDYFIPQLAEHSIKVPIVSAALLDN